MMAFDSFSALLAMGGHGAYVWSAWGLAALLLIGSAFHARAERHHLMQDLKRRQRRERHADRGEAHES